MKPLFPTFAASWEITEAELPREMRRRAPFRFGAGRAASLAVAAQPLAVVEREAAPLLQCHPAQSASGREGMLQFVAGHQALLQALSGFSAVGTVALSRSEALVRLEEAFPGGVVRLAPRAEAAAGAMALEETEDPARLAAPKRVLLLSGAAIEELGARVVPFLRAARDAGLRIGAGILDLRLFGAGLRPAVLGFDFVLADASPLLDEGCVVALHDGILPSEKADGFPCLDRLLRLDCRLRALGGKGLAALAREVAVRAAYLQAKLRREAPGRWRGGSLLETWIGDRPPLQLAGTETRAELDRLAASLL